MKKLLFLSLIASIAFSACIKDDIIEDFVEPELRITTTVDSIALDSTFQFEAIYLNNIGQEADVTTTWTSSNENIISINNNGLATALQIGESTITVETIENNDRFTSSISVAVGGTTVVTVPQGKSGSVATTSSYALSGDFELTNENGNLKLQFGNDYNASTALPGLYIYLTNNPNSVSGALEIGAVQVFSGEHNYTIPNVGLDDYRYVLYFCKPFNVKVGDGEIE
jgi:hypothetical protein